MTEETSNIAIKLKRLMQTDIMNDTFYVWYSGPYGTINNFRLGNLSTVKPIEWNEINAALGQCVLAIVTVSEKVKFEFIRYKLYPMGSYSKVYKVDDVRNNIIWLNLYTDGTFQLFPKRSFNNALIGFLTCIYELGEFICSKDPTMQLPYTINLSEGKVNDQNVLLG